MRIWALFFLLILLVEYPVPVVLGLVVALWLFKKKLTRDWVWIKTVFDFLDSSCQCDNLGG
jgi:hypothetical protein